jgi:hypothetical protein
MIKNLISACKTSKCNKNFKSVQRLKQSKKLFVGAKDFVCESKLLNNFQFIFC